MSGEIKRPFPLEDEGKEWMMTLLSKKGYNKVVDTDINSIYTHFDLVAEKDGEKTIFELKNRDCYSDTWGDIEIQTDKYINLKSTKNKAILVYFWNDCWTMIDINKLPPTNFYTKMAQHSHKWRRDKELKKFARWDIKENNIQLLNY